MGVNCEIERIMTLEEVMNDGRVINIDEEMAEEMRGILYREIIEYHKAVHQFYGDIDKAHFKVHPKNVLIYLKKMTDSELTLAEKPIGLDIISVILN